MNPGTTCPECGHPFYSDWELIQHANGRHHYRAWTPEDGRRMAESMERKRLMGSLTVLVGGRVG